MIVASCCGKVSLNSAGLGHEVEMIAAVMGQNTAGGGFYGTITGASSRELKAWSLQTSSTKPDLLHQVGNEHLRMHIEGRSAWIGQELQVVEQGHDSESPAAGFKAYSEAKKKERQELLWQEFFKDPSLWWDNRLNKKNPQQPDFRHKTKNGALCISSHFTPAWVATKLGDLKINNVQCKDGELKKLCEEGRLEEAFTSLHWMDEQGTQISMETYECLLQACSRKKAIREANLLHGFISNKGLESNVYLGNSIVIMLVKCGSLSEALQVFHRLPVRKVSAWTELISSYVKEERDREALDLYHKMKEEGVKPNKYTLASILKACASFTAIHEGRQIHAEAAKTRCELDFFVGTALVDMYAKCGSMVEAQSVFDRLDKRDVVSWNTMILGYVQQELGEEALSLYARMQAEGEIENKWIFASVLKACACVVANEEGMLMFERPIKTQSLARGKTIHEKICKAGFGSDVFIGNALVHMYAKCGSIQDARYVFNLMSQRDLIAWNVMFGVYAEHELSDEALKLYIQMQDAGVSPDERIFVSMLKACSGMASIERWTLVEGRPVKVLCLHAIKAIHAEAVERSYELDVFIGNTLVHMYSKCGSVSDAQQVFDRLSIRDVVSWNAMLSGYAEQEQGEDGLQLYVQMQQKGVTPDSRTFVGALKACAVAANMEECTFTNGQRVKSRALQMGKAIHAELIRQGYGSHRMVCNTLVHTYAKCGSLEDARHVFDSLSDRDVVSWNAMIAGYAEQEEGDRALQAFAGMQAAGVLPDSRTYVATLKACGSLAAMEKGEIVDGYTVKADALQKGALLHAEICRRGYASDTFVCNSLINMYAKCGSVVDARKVFDTHPGRDVVSWNSMMGAYIEQELELKALQLYLRMKREGVKLSEATFLCILRACGNVGALRMCTDIRHDMIQNGMENSVLVATALIHAYGKCGRMVKAQQLFDTLSTQDVVAWNGLISGYARHGDYTRSLQCFKQMQDAGIRPDAITFVCLFTACSHAGTVEKGLQYFMSMSRDYRIAAVRQHYSCVIDLLGRAGLLKQAETLLLTMPVQPDVAMWLSLLGACRKHGDMESGRRAFNLAVELEPKQSAAYILMSNIYALSGLPEEARQVERMRRGAGGRKRPGQSWIEHRERVLMFSVKDKNKRRGNESIITTLEELNAQIINVL